ETGACRRATRARRRALGRNPRRWQKPRGEPAAARARPSGRPAYHRGTQLDISGARRAGTGQGRRGGQDPAPLPMTARALVLATFLVSLSGCSTQPLRELMRSSKGAATLASGLRQYDEGEYADAARNLQAAI